MENRLYRTTFYDNEKDKSGGSGDFSIAKVTITSDSNYPNNYISTIVIKNGIIIYGDIYEGEKVVDVPLGENGCFWWYDNEEIVCTGSGDYTIDEETGEIIITGDCSLAFHTVGGEE